MFGALVANARSSPPNVRSTRRYFAVCRLPSRPAHVLARLRRPLLALFGGTRFHGAEV
jgi:hypothetical protein